MIFDGVRKTTLLAALSLNAALSAAAIAPEWCTALGSNNQQLKVLPMGASLVYGLKSSDENGFRKAYLDLLEDNGTRADMLGSQMSGNMAQNHHEAYLAVTIGSYLNETAKSGAFDLHPDVILLLLGVNDCWYMADEKHAENPDPAVDPRTTDGKLTADRFGGLLAKLNDRFPDALVLASQLTRNLNPWQDTCIRGFNSRLPAVVANATSHGQTVRWVDMYDAVGRDEMQEDGTHPTDAGYELMAARWYNATAKALGEVCGGEPATMVGKDPGELQRADADDGDGATGTGTEEEEGGETIGPRPTLTLDSGAGIDDGQGKVLAMVLGVFGVFEFLAPLFHVLMV